MLWRDIRPALPCPCVCLCSISGTISPPKESSYYLRRAEYSNAFPWRRTPFLILVQYSEGWCLSLANPCPYVPMNWSKPYQHSPIIRLMWYYTPHHMQFTNGLTCGSKPWSDLSIDKSDCSVTLCLRLIEQGTHYFTLTCWPKAKPHSLGQLYPSCNG